MKAYRRRFVLFNMLLIGVVLTVMAAGIAVLPSTAARRRGRYFSLSSRERNPRSRRHNSLLLLKTCQKAARKLVPICWKPASRLSESRPENRVIATTCGIQTKKIPPQMRRDLVETAGLEPVASCV